MVAKMSDKSHVDKAGNLINAFKRITMKRFMQFLSANGIDKLSCPLCKNSDTLFAPTMKHPDTDDNHDYFLMPVKVKSLDYDYDTMVANYSYRVVCQNCAHEMHFSCQVVAAWDQQNRGDDDGC